MEKKSGAGAGGVVVGLMAAAIVVILVVQCSSVNVEASSSSSGGGMADACYFYWGGGNRGQFTGPDSLLLQLDKYGGSGMTTKSSFLYGKFELRLKLVSGNSAGTVTTLYLSSSGEKHDEIDFEFLGNTSKQPYTIHTNIYTQGFGKREQQFRPWFDPTSDYHKYTILWTRYSVVWLIDDIPIRVFRQYNDNEINYPDSQDMKLYASLWNADDWATQGGKVKTDWTLAPFKAYFTGININACHYHNQQQIEYCNNYNNNNWWTSPSFYKLTNSQYGQMMWVRKFHMIYDYCTDYNRFNGKMPKECSYDHPQY